MTAIHYHHGPSMMFEILSLAICYGLVAEWREAEWREK